MRKIWPLPTIALLGIATMAATHGEDPTNSVEPVGPPEATAWNIDKPHTEINFSVRHFFTPVTGTFKDYDVEFWFDRESPENSSVSVTVQVASIDTKNQRRDDHLRSADFFDAENHPRMTFQSTSVRQVSENEMVATGDLTIKGITREVELPITMLGVQEIPEGPMREMLGGITQVASFQAGTQLDRREFEVGVANWAQTVIVGGDVEVTIFVEANR
ncbi:MAG: YceI family protein [Gemmatimonadota bacterium]